MKIVDKVYCHTERLESIHYYDLEKQLLHIKGRIYDIVYIYDDYVLITSEIIDCGMIKTYKYRTVYTDRYWHISDLFMTEKEYRKQKLKKINESD